MKRKLLALLSMLACMSIVAACGASSSNESASGKDSGSEVSSETSSETSSEASDDSSIGGNESSEHTHSYGDWKSDDTNHWKECACKEESEKGAHSGGEATCTAKAKCEVCGEEYGALVEHSYTILKYDADGHWYECECGASAEKEGHKGGDAACTGAAICEVCEQPYGKVGEHIYNVAKKDDTHHWNECACGEADESSKVAHEYSIAKNDETNHWNECSCGVQGEVTAHSYEAKHDDNNHWEECVCGYKVNEVAHSFGDFLTNDEKHWKECECGAISEESVHPY